MGNSLTVQALRPDHLPAAAAMVARRATALRGVFAGIRLTQPTEVIPLLERVARHNYTVCALRDNELIGFIAAIPAGMWGRAGGYVPVYAFASTDPDATSAMYVELATRLAADDRYTHGISLWADDEDSVWHDFGFGGVVTEVVKELAWMDTPTAGIGLAAPEEAAVVADLDHRLHRYLEASPVFLPKSGPPRTDRMERRIALGTKPLFIAWEGAAPVGYIALDPEAGESPALVGDEIVHCNGAFVVAGRRNRGIGLQLMAAATNWSLDAGYTAMALDFETANTPGANFWAGMGFKPIIRSLRRTFG